MENVRCFGSRQRLDLRDGDQPAKWTVLLGDNGVGKTTLLQCLYAMAPMVGVGSEEGKTSSVPRGAHSTWLQLALREEQAGYVESSVVFDEKIEFANSSNGKKGHLEFDEQALFFRSYTSVDEPGVGCLCCAYGATRRMGAGSLESRDIDDSGASLFSHHVPLINAVEWLLQADYAARSSGSKGARQRRDAVKQALVELLPDVEAIREAGLDEDPPRPRVEVQTPYGWVGMRDLSLGYQTMVAWVVDLASRMFEVYSDSENPLAEAAVVLVDEIDLHLHPRWQRGITSYLDELFPNVQFIVTAHSPLVVQGAGVTNVAVLRRSGDEVEILNEPEAVRGWRVDQILTSDLFGLDSARSKDVEDLIEQQQRLLLLDAPTEEDQARLREIDQELATLAPGETARDREAWSIVHEFASKLGSAAGGKP